ncbi:uncharacterized protein LOC142345081 isoform X2 [Convolutriloba macropyga]|uniref:uncharacterized protein LOC142345081 isoform X2 n=1 Tax=Convolutriloba macropyga TaxID=536237 RepID=UPI003F527441
MVKFVSCCAPDISLPLAERQKEIDNYMKKRADYYRKCKEELIARKMKQATKKNIRRPRVKAELILDGIDIQCNKCFAWRTLNINTDVSTLPDEWNCCDGDFVCQNRTVTDSCETTSLHSVDAKFVERPTIEPRKNDEIELQAVSRTVEGHPMSPESLLTSETNAGNSEVSENFCSFESGGQTLSVNDKYPVGSLVLVRFGNRPAWPALVEQDPNYNVHFAVDLESPCLNDPNDMNSNNENDNYETENCSQNTEKKNEKDKLMEEEENELNRKKMSDFIVDPIAYHVSLMGDPVMRIWIKKQYINAYSQKQAIKGGLCSFTNEFSLTMRNMQSQAILMAEQVINIPREYRVSRFGFMKRYNGPIKQEPDFESASDDHSACKLTVYLDMTDEDKEDARYDTERYLFGDYYFAPMERTVPKLDQKGIDQLKEFGIKMEPEM